MDPITIGAGVMVLGGLVQLYNSEKARGAAKDRLKEIEDLYDSVKPPDYDLSVNDPPELHEETLQKPEFSSPEAAPKFNLDKLTPEKFRAVGKLLPEVAPYVAEEQPHLVEKTPDMQMGRDAQKQALSRFMSIGSGEFDPEYQEQVTKASRAAQADAQSRQASILQDFARRGQSGSGLQLAAQMGGASQAMDREAMSNLGAASQAYRNRLGALSQGAQLGGQIQNEDQSLQSRNADIINSFNQRMASGRQNWENSRAGVMNDANRYNLGMEQNISNANTQAANEAARQHQSRLDELAKYGYQAGVNAQNRQDANSKWSYGADVNERNYLNQLAMSKYGMAASEKDRQNKMKSQMYNDQMQHAGLKAGAQQNIINSDLGAAQDRNSAIQGLSNAAATYGASRSADNAAMSGQVAADDRAYMQKNGSFMDPEQRQKRQEYYDEYY